MRETQNVGIEGGMLPTENFDLHWPNIEKELDNNRGIWADYHTKQSIYDDVMRGSSQVWAFSVDGKIKVIVFTRICMYPAARVLHVWLALGNTIERLLPQIEATLECFAQMTECQWCEITGRSGWERKMKHRFKKRAVVLVAPVPPRIVN